MIIRTLVRQFFGIAAATLALTLLGACPASAHAVLVGSTPSEGERLPDAPEHATVRFNEPVDTALGGLRVLAADGSRVDRGAVTQPSPDSARVELVADLDDGTYLLSYRVISDDGHTISGAVVFAVGDVLDVAAVQGLAESGDVAVVAFGRIARTVTFLGALLAAGLTFFVMLLHDHAADRRRYLPIVRIASITAAVGAIGVVVAKAADATGRGLGAITDDGIAAAVLRQGGLGWATGALLIGVAAIHVSTSMRPGAGANGVGFYGAVLTVGSFALAGHSADAEHAVLVGLADVVHVGVAALWFGGLVGLALLVRWRGAHIAEEAPVAMVEAVPADAGGTRLAPSAPDTADAATTTLDEATSGEDPVADSAKVLIRFSTAAAVAVAVLWVSGGVLSWSMLGEPQNLTTTDYGRTLAVKLVFVAVVLAMAAYNRWRLVPAVLGVTDDDDPDAVTSRWAALARSVRLEAAVLVVVLLVTAALVNTPPARSGELGPSAFNETIAVDDDLDVNLAVAPGAVGENTLHITYLTPDGMLSDRVDAVTVQLSLPALDVGPIDLTASPLGPGHFLLDTDATAVAGIWELELLTRLDGFSQQSTSFSVPIGEP